MESTVQVSLRELLEVGAHFGHQRARWNPRMKPYIFGLRGGVYIIDLQKTVVLFQEALDFLQKLAAQGKTVLFVGTKRQAQDIVARESARCEMFYIHQRWLGGILTNWQTVKKSIDKMRDLENIDTDKRFAHLKKKERLDLSKEHARLHKVLAGVRDMTRRPDALFVVDTGREHIALNEANKLGMPVIGLVDTNSDPSNVDFPIPANDDAIRSIELFVRLAADAILEGRNQWKSQRSERASRSASGGAGGGRRRGGAREQEPPVEAEAPTGTVNPAPSEEPASAAERPTPEASAPEGAADESKSGPAGSEA